MDDSAGRFLTAGKSLYTPMAAGSSTLASYTNILRALCLYVLATPEGQELGPAVLAARMDLSAALADASALPEESLRWTAAAAAAAMVAAVAAAAAAAPLVLRCVANTLLLGYAAASFFCSTRCSRSQQCRAFRRLAYPPDCRQGRARWRSFCSRTCLTPDRCSGPHQRPALQAGRCLPVQRLDFTKLRLQPCFSPSGPLLFGCTLVYMAVLRLFWPVGPPPPPKQRLSPV